MKINVITISKQCSDILNISPITLSLENRATSELYDKIYDLYPTLDTSNYNLYWRYNQHLFYLIVDYLSYQTILNLMFDKTLYLVLNDCDEHCDENEQFLRKLDRIELAEQKERDRDIYDVKIIRPGEEEEEEVDEEEVAVERTDADIILYAVRKFPDPKYYTSDLILKSKLVEDLKRGWKKVKLELIPLADEVIERKIVKPATGSKKDSAKGKKK